MSMARQWYRFEAAANDPTTFDINVLGMIGGDGYDMWPEYGVMTAKAFIADLAKIPIGVTTVRVHINSPGGDAFGAITIANALRDQQLTKGREVVTIVEGLAASAASVIAMAGRRVEIGDNALMMVHNPLSYVYGNAAEMRKTADALDTLRGALVATYRWHSPLDPDDIIRLMDDETWMDADDAITYGFATDKVAGLQAAAVLSSRDVGGLRVPTQYAARVQAWTEPMDTSASAQALAGLAPTSQAASAADVLRLCRDAGCDLALAQRLIDERVSLSDAQSAVTADQSARMAESARAEEVRALCAAAHLEDLAAGYVASHTTMAIVRDHLVRITAKLQAGDVDGTLAPDPGSRRAPRIDLAAIYAARNGMKE